jgi:hypothetical protein
VISPAPSDQLQRSDRRQFLRRAAVGAVVGAAPLVTGLASPASAALTGSSIRRLNVRDAPYGAIPSRSVDSSLAFQTAIRDLEAVGGGILEVPPGWYSAAFDLGTGVIIEGHGMATQIFAPPSLLAAPRPIIGCGGRNLFNMGVRNLMIIGDGRSGGTARGIELVSTNGDVHDSNPGGAGFPNSPNPVIENVKVTQTGGVGVYLGTNMRHAFVKHLWVFQCINEGLVVRATDAWISDSIIGQNGGVANIVVSNGANKFTAVRADHGRDGWLVSGQANQFTGCESQDNSGTGLVLDNAIESIVRGFRSSGDAHGCRIRGDRVWLGTDNDVDMEIGLSDGYVPDYAVALENAVGNSVRVRFGERFFRYLQAGATDAFETFRLLGPASDAVDNELSLGGRGAIQTLVPVAGAVEPDRWRGAGVRVVLTGAVTVRPVRHRQSVAPGEDLTFTFVQDATGGRRITWDAAYGNAPQPDAAPGAVSVISFRNASDNLTPLWRAVLATPFIPPTPAPPAWVGVTYLNRWVSYDAAHPVQQRVVGDCLELRGWVKAGTSKAAVFTLPAGARPARTQLVPATVNGAPGVVEITTAGSVRPLTTGNTQVTLDGVRFCLS